MAKDTDPELDAPEAPDAEPPAEEAAAAVPKWKTIPKRTLIIAGAALAVLAAGGGTALYFMKRAPASTQAAAPAAEGEHEAAPAEAAPAEAEHEGGHAAHSGSTQYITLTPSFVVNLTDDEAMRYLQIEVDLATSESSTADAVKLHMPLIRNNLLLLMGQKHFHELDTREGKEKLRAEMLAEVQQVLTEQTGKAGVEAVYFTSFVMQ